MLHTALNLNESERALRQISLPGMGLEGQLKLKNASVLIVGLGGLGCPVALYLAALGVGKIGLVDGDRVAASNLHRQVLYGTADLGELKVEQARRRLAEQNPHVELVTLPQALSYENVAALLSGYDLVVDGSDNFACRYLINDACVLMGLPFVSAAVQQFEGQVAVYNYSKGACYRCLFASPPPPGQVQNCAEAGVLGVLPGLMGMLQATEVAKVLLGLGAPLSGRLLVVDALQMAFREVRFAKDPGCPACGKEPQIRDLSDSQRRVELETARCETAPLLQIAPSRRGRVMKLDGLSILPGT